MLTCSCPKIVEIWPAKAKWPDNAWPKWIVWPNLGGPGRQKCQHEKCKCPKLKTLLRNLRKLKSSSNLRANTKRPNATRLPHERTICAPCATNERTVHERTNGCATCARQPTNAPLRKPTNERLFCMSTLKLVKHKLKPVGLSINIRLSLTTITKRARSVGWVNLTRIPYIGCVAEAEPCPLWVWCTPSRA